MDHTPKLQRKSSLSLSTRRNTKKHSASPQNVVRHATTSIGRNGCDLNANIEVPRSPSIHSVCSDVGIECTPPHKKPTMGSHDDSIDGDYSPKVFDSSFSPSCFLSQTMAVDSPEVGWKWKRANEEFNTRTPDSAYAADSSFTSAGSSSTEMMTTARARSDNYNKRKANDARRELELRRVQMSRADEKLKQRCAKLQEQLKCAGAPIWNTNQYVCTEPKTNIRRSNSSSTTKEIDMISQSTSSTLKLESPVRLEEQTAKKESVCQKSLNDFFNDSDDCFLLAATQEIESKIKTPPPIIASESKTLSTSSTASSSASTDILCTAATTSDICTPVTKEKRSSFYMKFLEDDCTDDWFISLDEIVLQATQSKKPRTSLQRYKSMPTKTNDAKTRTESTTTANSDSILNESTDSLAESSKSSVRNHAKIKRHSSSHALSPVSANYRDRQNRQKNN